MARDVTIRVEFTGDEYPLRGEPEKWAELASLLAARVVLDVEGPVGIEFRNHGTLFYATERNAR